MTGVTTNRNVVVPAAPLASVAVTSIVVPPEAPAAGVMVSVRLEPEPLNARPELGMSAGL